MQQMEYSGVFNVGMSVTKYGVFPHLQSFIRHCTPYVNVIVMEELLTFPTILLILDTIFTTIAIQNYSSIVDS